MMLRQPPDFYNTQLDLNLNGAFLSHLKALNKAQVNIEWEEDFGSDPRKGKEYMRYVFLATLYASMLWQGLIPNHKDDIVNGFHCRDIQWRKIYDAFEGTFSKLTAIDYVAPPARPEALDPQPEIGLVAIDNGTLYGI